MNEDDESPQWRRSILEERDRLIAAGEAVFLDWEQVKEALLKETP